VVGVLVTLATVVEDTRTVAVMLDAVATSAVSDGVGISVLPPSSPAAAAGKAHAGVADRLLAACVAWRAGLSPCVRRRMRLIHATPVRLNTAYLLL
jgi:hypothetical protein